MKSHFELSCCYFIFISFCLVHNLKHPVKIFADVTVREPIEFFVEVTHCLQT